MTDGSIVGGAAVAARTAIIPPGDVDCPFGGTLIETGIDVNMNGILDANEVDDSEKVCNGPDGFNSLIDINPEPASSNCPFGGLRVDTGVDTNRNGMLDAAEITQTGYVCAVDSASGWQVATLLETDDAGGDAFEPQVGVDANGNAFAFWKQFDGTRDNIWANRLIPQ